MKHFLFILAIASIVTGCNNKSSNDRGENGNERINLLYKFQKEQTFFVITHLFEVVKHDSTQKIPNDTLDIRSTYKYTVTGVDQTGVAHVKIKYVRNQTPKFDSKDSSTYNSREGFMFKAVKDYEFDAYIDPTGKLFNLTGGDNFFTFGQPDSLIDDNKIIESDLNHFFHMLPGRPVGIGDAWETKHTTYFRYPGQYNTTFILREIAQDEAVIEMTSQMKEYPEDKTYLPDGSMIQGVFRGNRTGVMRFNLKTGLPTSCGYNDTFKGKKIMTIKDKSYMQPIQVTLKKEFRISSTME